MRNFVNLFIKHRRASSAITVPYCSESHFSSASIGFSRFLFAAHLYIVHVLYTPQSIVAERNGNTIFVYINASSVGFCWQKRDRSSKQGNEANVMETHSNAPTNGVTSAHVSRVWATPNFARNRVRGVRNQG